MQYKNCWSSSQTAAVQLRDGKPLSDLKMNWIKKFALGKAVEKVQDTDLGRLLLEYKII